MHTPTIVLRSTSFALLAVAACGGSDAPIDECLGGSIAAGPYPAESYDAAWKTVTTPYSLDGDSQCRCHAARRGTCGGLPFLQYSGSGLNVMSFYYDSAGQPVTQVFAEDNNAFCGNNSFTIRYGAPRPTCTPVITENNPCPIAPGPGECQGSTPPWP